MAKILLFITSGPETDSGQSALSYAEQAVKHHSLAGVFFYSDAVYVANKLRTPPSDEINITQGWQTLSQQHAVELIVCSAAAQRRGILDASEADYHGLVGDSLAQHFRIGGLGEYVELQMQADRVVQF
ncbi:sulfurtransferase complex subunit TusD [Catenovulum agarivorans]|uniref:sulfurtransferase complex subunit TusD n=1 Tax=Catenovulum agarivorans TaxID=1172192 RepID=UPI0002F992A9|nr:sulfurtransferase complex subunit TusD [Catenovulum agarivorans]